MRHACCPALLVRSPSPSLGPPSRPAQYVNRTSKQVVQEVALQRFASPLRGAATMPLGLCRDQLSGRIYVLAGGLRAGAGVGDAARPVLSTLPLLLLLLLRYTCSLSTYTSRSYPHCPAAQTLWHQR